MDAFQGGDRMDARGNPQIQLMAAALAVWLFTMRQRGWKHRWFLRAMDGLAIALFLSAVFWPQIASSAPYFDQFLTRLLSGEPGWVSAGFLLGLLAYPWLAKLVSRMWLHALSPPLRQHVSQLNSMGRAALTMMLDHPAGIDESVLRQSLQTHGFAIGNDLHRILSGDIGLITHDATTGRWLLSEPFRPETKILRSVLRVTNRAGWVATS